MEKSSLVACSVLAHFGFVFRWVNTWISLFVGISQFFFEVNSLNLKRCQTNYNTFSLNFTCLRMWREWYLNLMLVSVNKSLYVKYSFVCKVFSVFLNLVEFIFFKHSIQVNIFSSHTGECVLSNTFSSSQTFIIAMSFNGIVVMKMANKCTCSCQITKARTWCHTQNARAPIEQWLKKSVDTFKRQAHC